MRSYTSYILQIAIIIGSVASMMMACTESFEERCRREAREYSERECPRMIEKFIRMDSMTFVNEPVGFVYYYTVLGEFDNKALLSDELVETFRAELLNNIRNDINMKRYKEKGFTFTYSYQSGSTGEPFIEASFGPDDYK